MVTLNPAAVGKGDDYTVFQRGTEGYEANKGLDTNKDGKIKVGEAADHIIERREQFGKIPSV